MASYNSYQADLNSHKIKFVFKRLYEMIEDKEDEEINNEVANAINHVVASTASKVLSDVITSLHRNKVLNHGDENTKEILEMSKALKDIMESCYWEMRAETYSIIKRFKYKLEDEIIDA